MAECVGEMRFFVFCFFETDVHVSWTDFQLSIYLGMTLNF